MNFLRRHALEQHPIDVTPCSIRRFAPNSKALASDVIAPPSNPTTTTWRSTGATALRYTASGADAPFSVIFRLVQYVFCLPLRCEGTEEPRVCIGRGFIAEATRQTAGDSSIIESTHER